MARALVHAETLSNPNLIWIPTWQFTDENIPKSVCDKLFEESYFDKRKRGIFLWSQRLGRGIFDPIEKDSESLREINILLTEARSSSRVGRIITNALDIDSETPINEIRREFLRHKLVVRLRLFNLILRELDRSEIDTDAQELTYRRMCNLYKLVKSGQRFLSSIE